MMLPKVEGAWDIHYLDQLLAQLEAKHAVKKPILIHAILETAEGRATASPISRPPRRAHAWRSVLVRRILLPSRAMKTTRVGDGHPDYRSPCRRSIRPPRPMHSAPPYQQDLWHYTTAKMVDACAAAEHQGTHLLRSVRRFRRQRGLRSAIPQRVSHGLRRRPGHCIPIRMPIAKRVFSPDPSEVAFAKEDHRRHARTAARRRVMIDE